MGDYGAPYYRFDPLYNRVPSPESRRRSFYEQSPSPRPNAAYESYTPVSGRAGTAPPHGYPVGGRAVAVPQVAERASARGRAGLAQGSSSTSSSSSSAASNRAAQGAPLRQPAPPKPQGSSAAPPASSFDASSTAAAAATAEPSIELPLNMQCRGNCGFFGSEKTLGLCSTCFKMLESSASRVTKDKVFDFLLRASGFESLADAQRAVAFGDMFPGVKLKESSWDVGVEGMRSWVATIPPVTQYDAIPRRGESACTFIAAVCALNTVWWGVTPTQADWSIMIRTGVDAFHLCKAEHLKADSSEHKNVSEVMPFVVKAMGIPADAVAAGDEVFQETVVGLYRPQHLLEDEYVTFLGPAGFRTLGNTGLRDALRKIFSARGEGAEGDRSVGVVVTRPPETYCLCRGPDTETIYMRDSHRRRQFDFDSVEALLEWIKLEKSYFVAQPESPEVYNMVGLYTVRPTIRSSIMRATNQLGSAPQPQRGPAPSAPGAPAFGTPV